MRNTKLRLVLSLVPLALAGCATIPLPQEKREFSIVDPTTVTKSQGYNNLLIYLGKTLGDSNSAIKLKDPEQGTVVARIGVECNNMRGTLDITAAYTAFFNVQAEFKDQKVRTTLEALEFSRVAYRAPSQVGAFSSEGQVSDARPCAEKLKADILSAINGAGTKKADW